MLLRCALLCAVLAQGQGIITTIAGNGTSGLTGNGGSATSAAIGAPQGVAVDPSGNVYFAELINYDVRVVNPAGVINLAAGCFPLTTACAVAGYGDGGPATAPFMGPFDVATDSAGNLYIADDGHNAIRKVTPAGIISTVAGNQKTGFSGDGGPATSSSFAWKPRNEHR